MSRFLGVTGTGVDGQVYKKSCCTENYEHMKFWSRNFGWDTKDVGYESDSDRRDGSSRKERQKGTPLV